MTPITINDVTMALAVLVGVAIWVLLMRAVTHRKGVR